LFNKKLAIPNCFKELVRPIVIAENRGLILKKLSVSGC